MTFFTAFLRIGIKATLYQRFEMIFHLEHTDKSSEARAGTLTTTHSTIPTPIFMPVGTQACVKGLDFFDLQDERYKLQAPIILGNTYHLYLRPGEELIKNLGGLHGFSGFSGSFLTDSGGFQAFSLSSNMKKSEEGIAFKSHIDGSKHFFSPEKVLDIQYSLNSDIMMVLDDLIGLPAPKERIIQSIETTKQWAQRSLKRHISNILEGKHLNNNIFAITQGGNNKELRLKSAYELSQLDYKGYGFDGFAIGGLAVGESAEEMYACIEYANTHLPKTKPRYLMGVGTPENLIEAIHRGVDMFDCVMPSRNARNGSLFTSFGKLNIKSSQYAKDDSAIDETCDCYTCQNFSRAYLHHLLRANEITYFRLATLHNLYYYLNLMRQAREAILDSNWLYFRNDFYSKRNIKIP